MRVVIIVGLIVIASIINSQSPGTAIQDHQSRIQILEAKVKRLEGLVSDAFNLPYTGQTIYSKIVTATAYTAREEECDADPWITATGKPSRVGVIGVSPDLEQLGISPGDMVVIKGYGLFLVDDRTGVFKRKNTGKKVPVLNTVDILHAHVKAAKIFGVKQVELIWLGKGNV